MLMTMYAAPPFPVFLDGVGRTGDLCSEPVSNPNLMIDTNGMPHQMSGLRGDPFGITDIIGSAASYFGAKAAADAKKKEIAAQIQEAKMAASAQAKTFALDEAQSQVQSAQASNNSKMYALYAIGGVATIVSVAFLLSAIGGKRSKGK